MLEKRGKKGIEPVVATVGLIGISIALFVIVFIWSRSFVTEKILKFGDPIEQYCDDLAVDIDIQQGQSPNEAIFSLSNIGNVNIYQIEVYYHYPGGKLGQILSAKTGTEEDVSLPAGTATTFGVSLDINFDEIEEIEIIPLILGEGEESKNPYAFACENAKQTIKLK